MKVLTAYYSRAGENYFSGKIRPVEKGNTEIVAEIINKIEGGTLLKIDRLVPYSENYKECVSETLADMRKNARPELTNWLPDIREYDRIYLGYPLYCGTVPMAVLTFLEHYDFSSLNIYPFCTHEGSGFGKSIQDIEKAAPGAVIHKGLSIIGDKAASSADEISSWLKETV